MEKIFNYLKRPDLYEKSSCKFWNDEHISKGMLEAHLNPDIEAASRKHEFIDESVNWISNNYPASKFSKLLDLGCGPGLYTSRFYRKGYSVTGVDYSKRSINHAKSYALENNQDINYIYKNYLEIDYDKEFDLITLIYCDYVVLNNLDRKVLLKKIYNALTDNGIFIFDVLTSNEFKDRKESNRWNVNVNGGFFTKEKHICLESHFIYTDNVRLDQYVIIDKFGEVEVIRNWFKLFDLETISKEVKDAGFKIINVYSDVAGKPYDENSNTICLIVGK